MSGQHFPNTMRTWIDERLSRGDHGLEEVHGHIMDVYYRPLTIYCQGSSLRHIAECEEIVSGFFVSYVHRLDYLERWRTSGIRLRRWLMNGLHLHAKDLRKQQQRHGRASGMIEEEVSEPGADAERIMARAMLQEIARLAMEKTRAEAAESGSEAHVELFHRYEVGGEPIESLARSQGVEVPRAHVMIRTARRRFVRHVRDLLERDGVAPEQIDSEVRSLLEESA